MVGRQIITDFRFESGSVVTLSDVISFGERQPHFPSICGRLSDIFTVSMWTNLNSAG